MARLLMSDFDRSIGHVRRYRKRELRERFERAGFDVVEARYVNMPGFVAWLLVTRLFNVATKRLVWVGTTETFNPKTVAAETPGFADVIIGQLAARGLVPGVAK